ncbi:MAG TPA: proton-conducting transporter membrane subunit [Candidatus Limnocylindrales bacterium]|nr:proton-conducting transporter membrane subunit [Candidatus Limnocylindrales bacterium]
MNTFAWVLVASLALAMTAALGGLMSSASWRSTVVGVLTGLSGLAGAVLGGLAVAGTTWSAYLPDVLPLAGISLTDALSGWFLLIVGGVTAAAGIYTIGYAGRGGHAAGSRTSLFVLPLFTASMQLVPLAASVPAFLAAWELMALTSLILVMAEHRHHQAVRPAALWYAAMTQAGFVTILIGLLWTATAAGDASFAGIRQGAATLHPFAADGIFLLCLAGFAAKAGAVPWHPWLPRAHAEAPSHVSALMSAAMVKLGIYGILRLGLDLLGGGPRWWWLAVAALGAVSALYGIVQAVVATDLKRLLAFSTTENVGLILLGIGFAGMLSGPGQTAIGAVAMTAALLHAVNHAGFNLDADHCGQRITALKTRLDQLHWRHRDLEHLLTETPGRPSEDAIVELRQTLTQVFRHGTPGQRKAVIEINVAEVTIDGNQIVPVFRIPQSATEPVEESTGSKEAVRAMLTVAPPAHQNPNWTPVIEGPTITLSPPGTRRKRPDS